MRRFPLPAAWTTSELRDHFAIYLACGDALNDDDTLVLDLFTITRKAS